MRYRKKTGVPWPERLTDDGKVRKENAGEECQAMNEPVDEGLKLQVMVQEMEIRCPDWPNSCKKLRTSDTTLGLF